MVERADTTGKRSVSEWTLRPEYTKRFIAATLLVVVLLTFSAQRTEIDRMMVMSGEALLSVTGITDESQVARGLGRIFGDMFPLVVAERREVGRIENFDPERLPWLGRLETEIQTLSQLNTNTLQMETIEVERQVLIEPLGYLRYVLWLMWQTIEIAIWGTILSVLIAIPLGYFGARNYAPFALLYHLSRTTSSFFRAMPELIIALFLVLAYGFGPIAGVLALGVHTSGFLGKFFAEDIENADKGPQEALLSTGANRVKVLIYTVLPQVAPSYTGYVQYILERNIRSATVLGIVGAGGIGQELKGRFEMFNFGHVSTILLVILLTVIVLEYIAGNLRKRMM
ncbi:phosphonate ABC transporter, permease protein PhnE [Pelovirga terrestris]|uniref:Phosphonate ABC transporter, permease protein PhnE n=1 Tax=Pelovirga terrestris TaxID=2771352 RepID=A0A8J6UH38_9BACT|nr:phosphonate ABC transporter, permease protein PhnE [Pelovirga terrestris]MBD1400873.1 phosphonate ABC transporter, permease protein PhnE [Pelovirga terrestris]